MRPQKLVVAVLVLFCSVMLWGQDRDKPSTPEERHRALTLTRKLERDPLGAEAATDRKWLTNWIIEIPDITVPVCDELLKPMLMGQLSQYRYSKELIAQQLAGSMAYLIEHPQEATKVKSGADQDDFAINKAGLESALNAYEAIVKSSAPGSKWAPLEELLKKRQAGGLDDYIRAATLKCVTGDTVTASLKKPLSTCEF
jgi:hypothetical protein